MIDLGLKRITQLLSHSSIPWKAIHVAGTNGKGSVCAYLSSTLHTSGLRVGRFTSPHLVHRWDCIQLNNTVVSESAFLAAEAHILSLNDTHSIGATEFELLTATAFELFTRSNIEVGVIEVGLGGKDDSTNVLPAENVLVTIVTKLGLDHQGFLGNTIEEIAVAKAGITKKNVPMVVDSTNPESVLDVIRKVVTDSQGGDVILAAAEPNSSSTDTGCSITTPSFGTLRFEKLLAGGYQPQNLSCAINALSLIASKYPQITPDAVVKGVAETKWPGRLETLDIGKIYPGAKALVDGAHNPQAQRELRSYVDTHIRPQGSGKVYWVLASTKGKDVNGMIEELLGENDVVIATRFGAVDGMPWISSVETAEIVQAAKGRGEVREIENCVEAVKTAAKDAEKDNAALVVAGSLYLVADLHRFIDATA
ncbi:Mur ligase [Pyronema omphalodes]|nr:Mur ligase [Pyronema omphalodes]